MSNQTVVDVIISGSTTTIVDKRINGVTTVAGAPPITNVSGQVPDLGVNTDILAAEGDILSLTNDVANLRANLIVTGTTLTDEIGVLSGHVISTGNNLEFQISTLSGNLIASGNNLDSLRDILSGNLAATGSNLKASITGITGDINTLTSNLISTGDNLQTQILNSGDILDDLSGNLITTGQTLTSNLISTGNLIQPQIDNIESNLITTGQTLLTTGSNLQALIVDNTNNLIDTGNNLEPRINTNVVNISTLNTVTGVLSTATGELQEYKFNKSGGTISGSLLPSSSGIFNLGSPSLTFQTGYFDDLEAGNTLFVGGVPIKSVDGGINFFDATGIAAFRDVSIRNLTVTGTETIIDVEHLAVKDNIIIINSGESGAGIGVRSGGLVIDRGTLPDADFLFNENNDRFEIDFPLAVNGNVVVTQNQTGVYASSSNLTQTGVTLQNQITSNDTDITNLGTATGELKTQSNATDSNLTATGQTLTSEIAIVSGIAGGSTFDALSGNLITTGQTLTSEIAIVSGMAGGSDLATLSGNLISTGQTLQTQITSNDSDISTLTSNLVTTGSRVDDVSGNLITTGQTLQTQIASNDSDIVTLTSNLTQTGVNVMNLLIETGFAILDTSGNANTISDNLISTGKYLTDEIATVSGMATGGAAADTISGDLITTGQTLTSEIGIVSGLTVTNTNNLISTGNNLQGQITSNDGQIAGIIGDLINTGQTLTTNDNTISSNLITTGQTLTSEIAIVSGIATGGSAQDFRELSGNLITTGQTLQAQVTSNDSDVTSLTSNLITTGQTLTSEIAIVSGLAGGGDIDTLSGNLITTGQTLQTQITSNDSDIASLTSNLVTTGQTLTTDITTVSGLIVDNDGDITALKTATGVLKTSTDSNAANLITTGQTLQTQITSNDSDISSLTSNLVTTGQTLQAQITSNDGDISTLTTNLGTTGQTLQTQITSNDSDISTLTSNLITTGQTLTTDISTVSGLITDNDADIAALRSATGVLKTSTDANTTNLITTGQTLQTQITSNDGDITTLTSNLVTTGQTLQTQITSNDSDISTLTTNVGATGQTLQTQITSNDSDITNLTNNLITTGQTVTTDINTVSGLITDNDADITALKTATGVLKTSSDSNTANLITTGQTLQTQIISNDGDISTLTSNLVTTGQTLTTNVNTVSTNLISTGAVVDDISGNLITTGQTLQTQINSNDGDITTLTSNLVTTGQTLTTNINTVSTNLGTSGQTLQTQITSNDSDISTLTSNLGTTGQTLQTQITSNDSDIASLTTNLGTTGQTLQTQITSNDSDISTLNSTTVKLTTNQSVAGNKIFTNDVTINNLTVTGTEVIVDVENLAVKDNIIEINSGESSAGISKISGGIVIDRGTATNANILFNDANDRFELNFPLAVEGEVVASASNLITTGQTLTTNINTVSTNLGTSGQTLQTQITNNDSDISTLTTNLGTSGQTLQTQITSNDSDISTLTTDLGTTGQTLQTQITSNDSDISTLTSNLVTTGQTLQTQITSNDSDISTLTSNLSTTGQTLTTNINTVSTNLGTSGQTLQTQITSNDTDITNLSSNLITTGQTLQTQITSNDSDITTLSSNLVTTGQTLTTNINTVSTNLISTGKVVDDISGSLSTTGQTLQTQITSNDSDISTLTSNLVTTGQTLQTQITSNDSDISTLTSNLITTGQTLTTNINTVSTNLGASGQTLQTQITSNDTDITNLTSNLVTTGQTLTTNINTVANNLGTTGQTLTSEIATVSGLIPATVIDGAGTANKVPLWSDSNTIGDSVISQSSSKVGIGVASPAQKLHVAGSTLISNNNYHYGYTAAGAQATLIGIKSNNYVTVGQDNANHVATTIFGGTGVIEFSTGGSTRMTLASGGNFGIGIASPSFLLHLQNATTPTIRVDNTVNNSRLDLRAEDSSVLIRSTSNFPMRFDVNQTERMRIDTAGNVGIGTISPSQKLHVVGKALITNDVQLTGSNPRIDFNTNGSSSLRFYDTTNAAERMRITGAGNVGIGTIDPDSKLQIQGGGYNSSLKIKGGGSHTGIQFEDGGGTTDGYIYADSTSIGFLDAGTSWTIRCYNDNYIAFYTNNGTEHMRIKSDGNVGIGTASPLGKLDVYREDSGAPGLIARANKDGAKMNFGYTNNNSLGEIGTTYNNSTGAMRLWIGGNLNSNSTGHVGPTQQGTSSSSWFSEYNTSSDYYQINRIAAGGGTSSSTLFYITSTGNVGIGGVTPTLGKLQVAGRGYFGPVGTGDATTKALMDTYSVLKLKPHNTNSTNMTFAQVNGGAGIGIQVTNSTQTADWDIALNPYGGNVGIGTTSPGNKLSIVGSATATNLAVTGGGLFSANDFGTVFKTTATATKRSQIFFKDSSDAITSRIGNDIEGANNAKLQFIAGSGSTPHMSILSGGNVGIGTTSPNKKLEVVDSTAAQILAKGWGPDSAGNDGGAIQLGEEAAFHGLFSYDNATSILYIDNAYNSSSGDIRFRTKTSGTAITAVTIEGDGDVGIGTTDPKAKFEVDLNQTSGTLAAGNYAHFGGPHHANGSVMGITLGYREANLLYRKVGIVARGIGDVHARQDLDFLVSTAADSPSITPSDARLTISGLTGDVGIGTTSPTTRLQVKDSVDNSYQSGFSVVRSADNATTWINVRGGATNFNNRNHTENAGLDYRWFQNGSEKMRLNTDGNVGIGTANPGHGFTVHKSSGAVNTPIAWIHNSGNVSEYDGTVISTVNNGSDIEVLHVRTNNTTYNGGTSLMLVRGDGHVGINTASPSYELEVNGTAHVTGEFTAGTKSFLIDHPTKENHMLQYGSLEGPEFGVYVRGKTDLSEIELPEVWISLVHEGSITVSFTPRGKFLPLFLNKIENNTIYVGGTEGGVFYDYVIYGTRKDVDDLVTEFIK